jgi:hypothetical protein
MKVLAQQSERLNASNDQRHGDRDRGDSDVVVELANGLYEGLSLHQASRRGLVFQAGTAK